MGNRIGITEKLDIDDVEPLEVKEEEYSFSDVYEDDINDDYRFIRAKLRTSVATCEAILQTALKAITISPNPKSVDACSNTVKIMISASKELQDMHERQIKMNKLNGKSESKESLSDSTPKEHSLNDILDEIQEKGI